MCKAAKVAIAEVEELVETGTIDPDSVHLPGIFVDRIIVGSKFEKRIEVSRFNICNHNLTYVSSIVCCV